MVLCSSLVQRMALGININTVFIYCLLGLLQKIYFASLKLEANTGKPCTLAGMHVPVPFPTYRVGQTLCFYAIL